MVTHTAGWLLITSDLCTQTIAIWMMVLVTIDRFTCVCRPLVAPRYFNRVTRRRYAFLVFVVGFLYNLPR